MSVSPVKRMWSFGWVVLALCAGCDEPPVIPTTAPGYDPRAAYLQKKKEKDEPAAIGEVGPAKPAADVTPPVLPGLEPAPPTAKGEVKTTKSGVEYETIKEGTGETVKAGQTVEVHYTGTLDDGRKFDSSRDRGRPATFAIGVGRVIKGWDEAVPGMKVGEVRKMTIPASAGYGALGKDTIPPNAVLHFEVEIVGIR